MIKVILAIWIFVGSLIVALISGFYLSLALATYPKEHIYPFGPKVPAFSQELARQLPLATTLIGSVALISIVVAIYFWRSNKPRDTKAFAVVSVSVLNYFLSFFFLLSLVITYFMLPRLANGAQ